MITAKDIISLTENFNNRIKSLHFTIDAYVYNPLDYAWEPHRAYIEKYMGHTVKNVFLGMNPGPFGMMQTGVPFGEVNAVRDYLKIEMPVREPREYNPARPVTGFNCKRSEVSGKRFWGLVQGVFPSAEDFFKDNAVLNYCPLVFISREKTAKNITPDKLIKSERNALEAVCNEYLSGILAVLKPENAIGIGKYAEEKLRFILGEERLSHELNNPRILSVTHPSPQNPKANRNWAENVLCGLKSGGVWQAGE